MLECPYQFAVAYDNHLYIIMYGHKDRALDTHNGFCWCSYIAYALRKTGILCGLVLNKAPGLVAGH